jgi:hypothetical protein
MAHLLFNTDIDAVYAPKLLLRLAPRVTKMKENLRSFG